MRLLALGAVLATVVATPAMAQDDYGPRIEYPTFTGFHAEIVGGVDSVRGGGDRYTGAAYGGNVGYDFAAGSLLLGIEGEATGSTAKECERNVVVLNDRFCLRSGRDLYAGGRVGIVSGNLLIYAKAGYTNARATLRYDNPVPANNFRASEDLDGVRVGGGVELDLSGFLMKAEYRYSNYEADFSRHQGVVGVGMRF